MGMEDGDKEGNTGEVHLELRAIWDTVWKPNTIEASIYMGNLGKIST